MAEYIIEQYELHAQQWSVEADSEAEALEKFLEGDASMIEDGCDYVEVADEYGMKVTDQELIRQLHERSVIAEIAPTVKLHSIRKLDEAP